MKTLPQRRRRVAVIGPGVADRATLAVAAQVGTALAANNAILICGGLGGCMAAAAEAAHAGGGTTIGILPGYDADAANDGIQIPLPTGLGEARNVLVISTAEAVIAIAGGPGTLAEIAHALKLGRRVVGLGTWDLRAPDGTRPPILVARDALEAVRLALES